VPSTFIEYIGKILPIAAHAAITTIIDEEFNISFIPAFDSLVSLGSDDAILKNCVAWGKSRGINFVDFIHLKVCDIRGIHNHKVFKDVAERGFISIGWF